MGRSFRRVTLLTCFAHVGQLVRVVAAIVVSVARPRQRHALAVAACVLPQCTLDVRSRPSGAARGRRFVRSNCNQKNNDGVLNGFRDARHVVVFAIVRTRARAPYPTTTD